HLLRARADRAGAGRGRGPRRPGGLAGRHALRPARVVVVAEDSDGGHPDRRVRADVREGGALTRLERSIAFVLRAGVYASSASLAAGLVLTLGGVATTIAPVLLQVGIVVLLCTPVARVVISTVEYAVAREWQFAILTSIVLLELMASAVAALVFN